MKLRDLPCEHCGWKFLGFHICVDPRIPLSKAARSIQNKVYRNEVVNTTRNRSVYVQAALDRYERERKKNAARDALIVQTYDKGDIGMRDLAEKFALSYHVVRGIINRAANRGEVDIRKAGEHVRIENVK